MLDEKYQCTRKAVGKADRNEVHLTCIAGGAKF
jgi:hypothetical protein